MPIEIKAHRGWQGGIPDCDAGTDAVWLSEPGAPKSLVALAHREPKWDLVCLVQLSQSQVESIKKALRARPCEKDNKGRPDRRVVLQPLPPEASDTDDEDDDE